MREDSLLYFETPKDFFIFFHSLDIYREWRINDGLLNERGKLIANKSYTNELRKLFRESGFFRMEVSIAEIVSWLDTLSLVSRLLESLKRELDISVYNKLSIGFEYMIQMSKKMRVDYIIEFEDKVLLLEFRTVKTFNKIRSTWENKFRELIIYKELLHYYKKDKDIVLYAFIALFEYTKNKVNEPHANYNHNQIQFLTEYIKKYLIY